MNTMQAQTQIILKMHSSILFPLKLIEVLLFFLTVAQSGHLRHLSYIHLHGTLHKSENTLKNPTNPNQKKTKNQKPKEYIHI